MPLQEVLGGKATQQDTMRKIGKAGQGAVREVLELSISPKERDRR